VSEVSDRYAVVADGFSRRVRGAAQASWSRPSPCTDWSAADVVDHVVGVHRMILASLTGDAPAQLEAGEDRREAWAKATDQVRVALSDPEQATRTVSGGPFGEQPFESLVGRLLCADTLIHTWDLARATGQDEQLDATAVEAALGFLGPIDEAIRRPGGFAAKIEPAPDADPQTHLLNFAGRAT
jgi:uncharacterized protein (TIGR03086 family)